jgi:4-amino-4-deoxy-L-arabinose transferase-like glycosyltransferase
MSVAAPPTREQMPHGHARRSRASGRVKLLYERPGGGASRALRLAPWLLLGCFLAAELAFCFAQITGPFMDEGIYVTAGLRTLQGHWVSDNYAGWFSGSMLWPVLAALGWKLAGLGGARAAAALCVTVGLAGMIGATGNLFGRRAQAGAALVAVSSGPVLALGHLAVYDTAAVAAAGGAFWAVTEFLRRDDRAWLVGAALLYALAGLSKYPVLIFVAPPLVLLILEHRGRRAPHDLSLFALVAGAILLVYFTADRAQLVAFESFRTQTNPNFGVSTAQIAFSQIYYTAVPLLLALAGAILLRGRRRIALALLTGVLAAPLYHLGTGNPAGDQKHVVFGMLFTLPLAGVAVARVLANRHTRLPAAALTAGLLVFGLAQATRIDESWPDLRQSAAVLSARVHPGERLLINSAWVDVMYLYDRGRIDSPYDAYDAYRVRHLAKPVDLCGFQWFIVVPGGEPWPASIRAQMLHCGTFKQIYSSSATMTNLGSNLHFVTYSEPIEIWHNEALHP